MPSSAAPSDPPGTRRVEVLALRGPRARVEQGAQPLLGRRALARLCEPRAACWMTFTVCSSENGGRSAGRGGGPEKFPEAGGEAGGEEGQDNEAPAEASKS